MDNSNRLKKTRQTIRVATNLSIVAVLSGVFVLKERFDSARAYEQERAEATAVLNELSHNITSKLNRVLIVSSSLSGAVSLAPDIEQDAFADFASKIALSGTGIVNIAAIRDFRIELVFPYDENAYLIGRSLRDVPEQFATAERARDLGESVLQGPVGLLQNIDGYILREPVFLNSRERDNFWGFISIVFSADEFFADVGLEEILVDYDVGISEASTGQAVFGDAGLPPSGNRLVSAIKIPGGYWNVGLAPKFGWNGYSGSRDLLLFYLFSLALVLGVANLLFNQRQKALQASEQLQSAIDVLADGFVLFDAEDRLVVCNEKYRDLYSASAPAIVPGAKFEEILRYGLKRGQYREAIGDEEAWLARRLLAHRAPGGVLEQQLEDGRWLRVREMPTPDGGRVGIRVDVTEQVVSRRRAEIAEGRLRDAIDTVPAGFWLFDPDEKLEIVNDRALEPFQRARKQISRGDSLDDMVEMMVAMEVPRLSPVDARRRKEHLLRQLRRASAAFEIRTGAENWFKYFSQRTNEGGLVCFGVDISELMQHERWLQQSNERLRAALKERDAAEARFADVADISTEWFWEQDANGHMTYLSPGFEKTTGIAIARVLGRKTDDLVTAATDELSEFSAPLSTRIAAREPFFGVIYKARIKPGMDSWLRTSGKPVYDEHGAFKGFIGTAADITPLYSALREARRADEAKTQFLNVISHELRTPMTIVLGFNAFLTKIEDLPEFRRILDAVESGTESRLGPDVEAAVAQVKRFAGKIQVAGEQLQRLINDMLDLARIEANTMRVEVTRVNAREVVNSIIDQMQPMLAGKDVTFVVDVEDLDLKSDESRLRQIFINLIANAMKFTDRGHITVRARPVDGMAAIEVEDTGVGIPPEALPSIFERFTQADASSTRNQGGAGLGLAISKELVRLQGGTVEVDSVVGQGTKITFTLPLWGDQNTATEPAAPVAIK